jgi:serine/threonine-protein kinase HipA
VRNGWRLSPAFDLNPEADAAARHATSMAGESEPGAAIRAALECADLFGLTARRASAVLGEVAAAVAPWRDVAGRRGLSPAAIVRFAPALDAGMAVAKAAGAGSGA